MSKKHCSAGIVLLLAVATMNGCGKTTSVPIDAATVVPVFTPSDESKFLFHASAVSASGDHVFTVATDGTAKVWSIRKGALQSTFTLPVSTPIQVTPEGELGGAISTIAINATGTQVLVCPTSVLDDRDPFVQPKILDSSTGKQVQIFQGHREPITASAFSPDGKKVLTGGFGGSAKLWNVEDGQLLYTFPLELREGVTGIYCVEFSKDGSHVLIADAHHARVWNIQTFARVHKFPVHMVRRASWSADDTRIATRSFDENRPKVWDLTKGELAQEFENLLVKGPVLSGCAVALSHDGANVATGYGDGTTRILSASTGECLDFLRASKASVIAMAYRREAGQLVTVSSAGTIRLWRASDGELLMSIHTWGSSAEWCCWTANGYFNGTAGICADLKWKRDEQLLPHREYANHFRRPELVADVIAGKEIPPRRHSSAVLSETTARERLDHLDQLVKALYAFKSRHNKLPTAVFKHPESGTLRSWRVEFLPHLGLEDLYQQYRLDEPWDSDANQRVLAQMPEAFRSRGWTSGETKTSFMLPVGEGTLFDPTMQPPLVKLVGKDGLASTIMLLESPTISIPWTKPQDLALDLAVSPGPLQSVGSGTNERQVPSKYELLADTAGLDLGGLSGQQFAAACPAGKAFFLNRVSEMTLRRLFCCADGERVAEDQFPRLSWIPLAAENDDSDTGEGVEEQLPPSVRVSVDNPFVNSLEMRFVPVPIRTSNANGRAVLFSVFETRVKDYGLFAKETPGLKTQWQELVFGSNVQQPDHPVVSVSWDDANRFCQWLTERERKSRDIGPNDQYRLPTDHEWSCAVGIGGRENPRLSPGDKPSLGNLFPWGTGWPPPRQAGNFQSEADSKILGVPGHISGYTDGYPSVAPVGSFPPNSLGIHDLAGNVAEWCSDLWEDPPPRGQLKFPTTRGSTFLSGDELQLASSARSPGADYGTYYLGFRCVLDVAHERPDGDIFQTPAWRKRSPLPPSDSVVQQDSMTEIPKQDRSSSGSPEIPNSKQPSESDTLPSNESEVLRKELVNSRWQVGTMRIILNRDGSVGQSRRFKNASWKIVEPNLIVFTDKGEEISFLTITLHNGHRRGDAAWKDGTKRTAYRRGPPASR